MPDAAPIEVRSAPGAAAAVRTGAPHRLVVGARQARWDRRAARNGDLVTLTVGPVALPPGTQVRIQVLEHDAEGEPDPVDWVVGRVVEDRVEARWACRYVEDDDDVDSLVDMETKGYTVPEYRFEAHLAHGEVVRSGTKAEELLKFQDWIDCVVRDPSGAPRKEAEYEVVLADGSKRRGKTGPDGRIREENVPPGDYRLQVLDAPASHEAVRPMQEATFF